MTTAAPTPPMKFAGESVSSRLASIDIFRGLTMAVMIFVNELASVHGLPWWTYHAPGKVDAMTYVDMVYPFFLFIVGLSIPLAIRQRLKKNPSTPALYFHVFIRATTLMHLNPNAWAILALTGASLFLSVYNGQNGTTTLHRWLRIFGLLLTVTM